MRLTCTFAVPAAAWLLTTCPILLLAGSSPAPAAEKPVASAEAGEAGSASAEAANYVASADEADGGTRQVSDTQPAAPSPADPAPVQAAAHTNASPAPVPSVAERIAKLETAIEADTKRLQEVRAELDNPQSEYVKAENNFRALESQKSEMQQRMAELDQTGHSDDAARLQVELNELEGKWTLGKERFDLAIAERKAMQESVATLERKVEANRASVAKLRNVGEPTAVAAAPAVTPPAVPPTPQAPAPTPAPVAEAPAAPPTLLAVPTMLGNPLADAAPANPAPSPAAPAPSASKPAEKVSKELAAANEAVQKRQAEAAAAEDEARTITDRLDNLGQDIEQQRQLRDTARKTVDNSERTLQNLNQELFRKLMAGEKIDGVQEQIEEATRRLRDNRIKSRDFSTRLDELQSHLARLQAEKLTAAVNLAQKREDAARAQAVVEKLKNPFTLRNSLQWLLDHGPRIVTILVALALFMWVSRVGESRLIELTAKRGRRGSREERENRAKTLLGVFRNAANIVLVAGGIVMILDEIGLPVAPIIGGAAVFGLAVAFGAQSLIKDYFVGFMVLLEQQYLINDVVQIGSISGQVERISLRITVLRDLEGRVHFIPHNQINTVTNLTHGWSRAVFNIGVAYKENVDHVIEVLTSLADELRHDDGFKLLILSDPVMLGVDAFGDSAVVIKFYIQTRPLQQWTVKREMLRRIKNEFDRLGIEIPFPHVTIYRGNQKIEGRLEYESDDEDHNRDAA
ncbi:MAG: mechanosensitive ion channel domain-containing protein [Pirellulales bacterium]